MNYQIDPAAYIKQRTNPRKLKASKSFIGGLFKSTTDPSVGSIFVEWNTLVFQVEEDPKTKNVRVTELIIDLKNSINQICNHFRACPQKHEISIQVTPLIRFELSCF